ncbi:PREDICTED: mucosal addressin cell adhesion molecule 1 [Elephantulus edwardii]|uniref:mucosal addressin cell adhesion molecule 1 n=1 Tax=Elephantulus edwardii TaxID=28737 RepID=UPI0003F0CEFD|nr:PREDICTED: mucosal addressin cell adhesion molecule 1 [Elephantulus edwardii]
MECGVILLLLGLGLPLQGHGQSLELDPPEPEVAVALGASQKFTCSLACPDGSATSVQWRGLDISLGSVQTSAGRSVLHIRNASLATAGTRLCVGSCGALTLQRTVQLLVYAFPDQLSVSPATLVPGQDRKVACTAHNVTPVDSSLLSFSLRLEDQELEGAESLGRNEEPLEDEDSFFLVTEHWLLPPLDIPVPAQLYCQATMQLPGLELSHRRAIPVMHSLGTPEPSTSATLEHPTSTSQKPFTSTSQESPMTVVVEPPSTAAPEAPTLISPEQDSNHLSPCHPEIHQPPSLADSKVSWELLCEVACGPPGTAVHWTQAPGGLEVYELQEAGPQAWLRVRQAGHIPRGWFQCRVDPGGTVANLFLNSEPRVIQLSAGLWMGTLVLGLLLLAFLACRLRRCFQSVR